MFKFLRRFHCSAQRLREVADDLRWDVVAVQAPVVAGEHPRVLLISPGHQHGALLVQGIDAARRGKCRRASQQSMSGG